MDINGRGISTGSTSYEKLNRRFVDFHSSYLTPRGLAYFFLLVTTGVFSLDVISRTSFMVWCLLFGVAISALASNSFRKYPFSVKRFLPPRTGADETITYVISIRNNGEEPLFDVKVREEHLSPSIWTMFYTEPENNKAAELIIPSKENYFTTPSSTTIGELAPGETKRIRVHLHFWDRGIYHIPSVRIEFEDGLQLTRKGKSFPVAGRIAVFPKTYDISSFTLTRARVYQPGGVPFAASIGESPEFRGLRDYMPGDPLRKISHKAWARTGKPVVREFQAEYFRRVGIILDTYGTDKAGTCDAFEKAISAVASIAHFFEENEYIIDIFAAGDQVYHLQAGMALGQLDNVLEVLSTIEQTNQSTFSLLDEAVNMMSGRLSALIIVATDYRQETSKFYKDLTGRIEEVKVIICTDKPPTLPPEKDVLNPDMLRIINPAYIEKEILDL